MTLWEIIKAIHDNGYEIDVFRYFMNYMITQNDILTTKNAEKSAQLTAIKKINQGKNKAIDALCEQD